VRVVELEANSSVRTFDLGRALGQVVQAGDVVGLIGDLGAGKTCFVQGVAAGLDVDQRYRVSSPTFTLINEYPGRLTLVHVDLYRLDDIDEMAEIGVFDYFGANGGCLVEWFDRCLDNAPRARMELHFCVVGEEQRKLGVWVAGARHNDLAQAWMAAVGETEGK